MSPESSGWNGGLQSWKLCYTISENSKMLMLNVQDWTDWQNWLQVQEGLQIGVRLHALGGCCQGLFNLYAKDAEKIFLPGDRLWALLIFWEIRRINNPNICPLPPPKLMPSSNWPCLQRHCKYFMASFPLTLREQLSGKLVYLG